MDSTDVTDWGLLLGVSNSVGSLAISLLSGVERGSIAAFSMSLSSMLEARADGAVFSFVHSKFEGLACDSRDLRVLLNSLLSVCLLAQSYSREEAASLSATLLSLLSSAGGKEVLN